MDRCREQAIGDSPEPARNGEPGGKDRVLRAKYLDWCSARIAARFLELTPEEIYELAEVASRDDPESLRGAVVYPGSGDEVLFRRLVGQVTESLAAALRLPTLEDWTRAYEAEPGRYESELLGFWREAD